MTRPAIDTGFIPSVTVQTPAHLEIDETGERLHGGNFAVAGGAVESGTDMHHVRKIDMVGQEVNPDPRDRLLLFPESCQIFDFQTYDRMACRHAGRNRRNAGDRRLGGIAVTEEAMDTVFASMHPMTEGERLNRRPVPEIERQDVQERQDGGNNAHRYDQSANKPR